jgi:hypothetical protein
MAKNIQPNRNWKSGGSSRTFGPPDFGLLQTKATLSGPSPGFPRKRSFFGDASHFGKTTYGSVIALTFGRWKGIRPIDKAGPDTNQSRMI